MRYFLTRKNTVRFAYVPCDFISLYLFVLTFPMKLKDTNYKSHWNIFVFYNQWKMMSDMNMSHGKMSDFVSFPLLGFILVIKPRNFDFKGHQNISLIKKWCQIWFCLIKQSMTWFKLCCLSKILATIWEIQILNFIKVV